VAQFARNGCGDVMERARFHGGFNEKMAAVSGFSVLTG
jgi:hypothetical protein